jgi:hypothetical protein
MKMPRLAAQYEARLNQEAFPFREDKETGIYLVSSLDSGVELGRPGLFR